MWRIDKDESYFTKAEKIAWNIVLPHKHLLILESDEEEVKKLIPHIQKILDESVCAVCKKTLRNSRSLKTKNGVTVNKQKIRKGIEELIKEDVDDVVHFGAYLESKKRHEYLQVSAEMLREKQSLINQVKLMSLIQSILATYKRNGFKKKELAEELADVLIVKLRKTKSADIENLCVGVISVLAGTTRNLSSNTSEKIKNSLKRVSNNGRFLVTRDYAKDFLNEFFK